MGQKYGTPVQLRGSNNYKTPVQFQMSDIGEVKLLKDGKMQILNGVSLQEHDGHHPYALLDIETTVVGREEWDEPGIGWAVGTPPAGDVGPGEGGHEVKWP